MPGNVKYTKSNLKLQVCTFCEMSLASRETPQSTTIFSFVNFKLSCKVYWMNERPRRWWIISLCHIVLINVKVANRIENKTMGENGFVLHKKISMSEEFHFGDLLMLFHATLYPFLASLPPPIWPWAHLAPLLLWPLLWPDPHLPPSSLLAPVWPSLPQPSI